MIIKESTTIQLEHYTEGPAMDNQGNVYCTTLTGGTILKLDRNDKYSVWGRSACPNGQIILSNGDHLVCDSRLASLVRYNNEGFFLGYEVQDACCDVKISVPNDLVADKTEGIYFTDSIRHDGKIFYRSNEGKEYVVAYGLDYPNGLVLSPDEKTLLVAESYRNRIVALTLETPGIAVGDIKLVAELPSHHSGKTENNLPDGIAIDNMNRLWIAHYGMQAIQLMNMDGQLVDSIEIPFPLVSNVFLSGTNCSDVIVTGGYGEPGPGAICRLSVEW